MDIKFRIDYLAPLGEELFLIVENAPKAKAVAMKNINGAWECTIKCDSKCIEYRFEVRREGQTVRREWGPAHSLELNEKCSNLVVLDRWHDMPSDRSFRSSMFTEGVFGRKRAKRAAAPSTGDVEIRAEIPVVRSTQKVVLVGAGKALGNWDVAKGVVMSDAEAPTWSARVKLSKIDELIEFKFVIIDATSGAVVAWERGENNRIKIDKVAKGCVVVGSLRPQFDQPQWRGAGVAIPVFSLRSEQSFGVGEFNDLKLMVDWAAATGQSIIQILPVHDTTMTGTWQDSYPYNANSTFALHPQFLHLPDVGKLRSKKEMARYEALGKELNALEQIDYERVNNAKNEYLHAIYKQDGAKTFASEEFKAFMASNEAWLRPYAVFCALRDEHSTPDFNRWGKMAKYTAAKAAKYEAEHAEEVGYNYFVQYHLSRQLRGVRDYAHSRGIVLKGDIPIGISRTSVDAWVYPSLFNMDSSAGAPPDDFSVLGQNWGFPTYNWTKMAEDGFAWWKARFVKMAEYFDAYRIDHILGFFRIWEIPLDAVNALLGHFNPALPFSQEEIAAYGFHFNREAHTAPVVVTDNVLFIEDKLKANHFHPRISAQHTELYAALSWDQKQAYDRLYNDFFYRRHNDFWQREALQKLPPLIESTGMLVCGEDLGMIPDCVAAVMAGEQILSLEIQRMPKDPSVEFATPAYYPYLSVCTTSTHDMNPIRAWWEEDRPTTQRFYNQMLGAWGEAPFYCEPWICKQIVEQHLTSPAMLTILPLQDWLAMDGELRRENPNDERINVPANSRHYWRYRMHLSLEKLLSEQSFNELVRSMIVRSGR
ncbi:MAG: 4-alpha-glucanotransferase [Rikenellaceae bacterium]|nr:4-alpha-glucanotransferase [Rikenellaceae bacterium]